MKHLKEFNNFEQQMFVSSFYCFLNYPMNRCENFKLNPKKINFSKHQLNQIPILKALLF